MKDREIEKLIDKENQRQKEHIELIASENFASKDVLKATGSILTNKYAEGYSGARYYGGCSYIDEIEDLANKRLQKLFKVNFSNVQPHSGTQANAAAISALVKPGGKILGMSLSSGGHLSHGYKITFSGTFFSTETYDTDENGYINYKAVEKIALKFKPDLIICGFSSYSRFYDFKKFKNIAQKVNAYLLADIAHVAGLVAVGLHPSPVDHADVITSTTHKTLRGARGGIIMTNNPEIAKKVNRWVFPGFQGGPLMHSIAGKAVAFYEALQPSFKKYIQNVVNNSKVFAEEFQNLGAHIISNGTDNHLFTVNVYKTYGISGKEASAILQKNKITVNKNVVPNDVLSPRVASGIRLGTPAMTTRGFTAYKFKKLARLMHKLLSGEVLFIKDKVESLLS